MKLVSRFLKAHPEHRDGIVDPAGDDPQFNREALGAFLKWAVVNRHVHVAAEVGAIACPLFRGRPPLRPDHALVSTDAV